MSIVGTLPIGIHEHRGYDEHRGYEHRGYAKPHQASQTWIKTKSNKTIDLAIALIHDSMRPKMVRMGEDGRNSDVIRVRNAPF